MNIEDFINQLNSRVMSPLMVLLLLFAGVVLSFKTGFIQFRHFGLMLKTTLGGIFKKRAKNSIGITPFQAMTTALSGTIGTGNIIGVATAISIGGPGAIFWIWVSAFLGMATKYSEILLAMKYRKKDKKKQYLGGPMYYIEKATGEKWIASFFAVVCIFSSFGIGNMTQSNTAVNALKAYLNIPDILLKVSVIIVSLIIGLVIIGGINRISKITSFLLPFMAFFYIGGCIIIICMDIKKLPEAIKTIFSSAFGINSVVGGGIGYSVERAIKIGFARGIFTNEAGLGSAPIAHSAAQNNLPALQGLWGMFEVFFDTIIMCTLTGVVIILSGLYKSNKTQNLALYAFEVYFSDFAAVLIAVSTAFFAISTIISWSYYGESCVKYLFSSRHAVTLYKLFYITAIYVGAFITVDLVWGISDILNALMMFPNIIGLLMLKNEIKKETDCLNCNNNTQNLKQ